MNFLSEENKNSKYIMIQNGLTNTKKERRFETENPLVRNPTFSENKHKRKNNRSESSFLVPERHTAKRTIEDLKNIEIKTKKKHANFHSSAQLQKYNQSEIRNDRLHEANFKRIQ